jgi:N-acetylneuraminic acid mutarotase
MKQSKNLLLVAVSFMLIISACSTNTPATTTTLVGNWLERSEFDREGRSGAASFVIGDTAYMGTGFDGAARFNDFWSYTPGLDAWTQRTDFLGVKRSSATAFAVMGKGYMGTGLDNSYNRLQDMYCFNPATNSWSMAASLPDPPSSPVGSGARYGALGFAIGNYGYISTGYVGYATKDLWRFDPSMNAPLGAWSQQVSMGGSKRTGAVVMVNNNKAYVCTGANNGNALNDMWVYDPANASTPWSKLSNINNNYTDSTFDDDYSDIARSNAVAFVINNKGYLTLGENGAYTKKTWEYNFATDRWLRKADFERTPRSNATAFTVGGRGYVGLGAVNNGSTPYSNLFEFKPDAAINLND